MSWIDQIVGFLIVSLAFSWPYFATVKGIYAARGRTGTKRGVWLVSAGMFGLACVLPFTAEGQKTGSFLTFSIMFAWAAMPLLAVYGPLAIKRIEID